jgi:hypothetical protein
MSGVGGEDVCETRFKRLHCKVKNEKKPGTKTLIFGSF